MHPNGVFVSRDVERPAEVAQAPRPANAAAERLLVRRLRAVHALQAGVVEPALQPRRKLPAQG